MWRIYVLKCLPNRCPTPCLCPPGWPGCGWRRSCRCRWSRWSGRPAAGARPPPPARPGTPPATANQRSARGRVNQWQLTWTTTQRRGVSAPPTMVTPRLAEVRGISTWDTSPSRMGSRVMPAHSDTLLLLKHYQDQVMLCNEHNIIGVWIIWILKGG